DRRGERADHTVLDQEGAGKGAARRAENLQHNGVVNAAVMLGRNRSAKHEGANSEGDEGGEPNRVSDHTDDAIDRRQRFADMDWGNVWKPLGYHARQSFFLGLRQVDRGEPGLWRTLEGARRKYHGEIDAEPLPIDRAQIGDDGRDFTSEQI